MDDPSKRTSTATPTTPWTPWSSGNLVRQSSLRLGKAGNTYQACKTPDFVVVFPLPETDDNKERLVDPKDVLLEAVIDKDEMGAKQETYPASWELQGHFKVPMRQLQQAYLKDFTDRLAEAGCALTTFRSCDGDELFLGISVGLSGDKGYTCAELEAFEMRYKFQTKAEVVSMCRIKQPLDEVSPAYIEYNPKLLKEREGNFQVSEDETLFKQYSKGIAGNEGSFMRTVDRVRLLRHIMDDYFDLEDAIGVGLIKTAYCVHDISKLKEFRSGQEKNFEEFRPGHVAWANFRICTLLRGLWEPQPIDEIRNYFGDTFAFNILWTGFTTRFLVLSLPVALLLSIFVHAEVHDSDVGVHRKTAIVYAATCFLITVWASLYIKFWTRQQSYYIVHWGVEPKSRYGGRRRPDYRGKKVQSPVDMNVEVKEYPRWKAFMVTTLSLLITCFFIACVIGTVLVIYAFEETLTTTGVSILFSLQIAIYQILWNFIALKLVDLENPRTDRDAADLSVQKLFPFCFVSTYANLAFHAIYKKWGEPCLQTDCVTTLRPSLFQVTLPAMFIQFATILAPYFIFRITLYREARALNQKKGRPANTKIDRSFIEIQSKRRPYGLLQMNEDFNVMMLQLGYVMIFGSIAPEVIFIVLVLFLVKIRVDAFKLCSVFQRTTPARSAKEGVGEWNKVLRSLAMIGRYAAPAIPVFNVQYLNDPELSELLSIGSGGLTTLQKVVLWFCIKEVLDAVAGAIDFLIPDVPARTGLMVARRKTVEERFRTGEALIRFRAGKVQATEKPDINTTRRLDPNDMPELWKEVDKVDFGYAEQAATYFGWGDKKPSSPHEDPGDPAVQLSGSEEDVCI